MDEIEKSLLFALIEDGRISFRALARKLGLSVTSVKKRFDRLVDDGVILRFDIYPSLAMLGAEYFWAFLTTAKSSTVEQLADYLGANPMIDIVTFLADGHLQCWGKYIGSHGLDKLNNFLYNAPGVVDVGFYTLLAARGKRCDLKPEQVKVLECLKQNVRMQVKDMVHQTGFSTRRVRRILDELLVKGGSAPELWLHERGIGDARSQQACFHARIDVDMAATGSTRFLVRIEYRGGLDARRNLVKWLKQKYPSELVYIIASASNPVLFTMFLVEYMGETPEFVQAIRNAPNIVSVKQIAHYQHKFYPGLFEEFWNQWLHSQ